MFTKITTKMKNMTSKDWIQAALWATTFILLLTIVILAATLDKNQAGFTDNAASKMYLDAAAKPDPAYVAFDPVAGHAVMTGSFTEITDANQLALYKAGGGVIGDGHKLFVADIAAYKSAITTPLDSYANAISGTAFTFAAFLFASMITTTVFAYKKRRGGNK